MRLSAEHPRDALARDESLLGAVLADPKPMMRWYIADAPALVVGLGLRHRAKEIIDFGRCRSVGLEVLERSAGGGLVLLDHNMLCCAICLPALHPLVSSDLTESYRWLGDHFASRLQAIGVLSAQRVEVEAARSDVRALRSSADPVNNALLATCYGALSPHEVVADGHAKIVGLAQVRRKHAALFQVGILLRDQSPLSDFLRLPDEASRLAVRTALGHRTVGLQAVMQDVPDLEELALLFEPDQFT